MTADTTALLFSGGLDSVVAYHHARSLATPVLCVHVDLGDPHERDVVRACGKAGMPLRQVDLRHLGKAWPRVGHVLPGRNMLLASIGALYGGEVWLAALETEMHPYTNRDKSHEFFLQASATLTYNLRPMRDVTVVTTPFMHRSKAEVVKLGLELGIEAEMRASRSCYDVSADLPCGQCLACVHRWVAMSLNGLHEQHAYPPWLSPIAQVEYERTQLALKTGDHDHYHRKRCVEMGRAMQRAAQR